MRIHINCVNNPAHKTGEKKNIDGRYSILRFEIYYAFNVTYQQITVIKSLEVSNIFLTIKKDVFPGIRTYTQGEE
jgi:hypothetical protein